MNGDEWLLTVKGWAGMNQDNKYEMLTNKILAELEEQAERCMKAICNSCRHGIEVRLGAPFDNRPEKVWQHSEPYWHDCGADRIRKALDSGGRG